MNGIIFFEDGTVVPFGQITSVQKIAKAVQQLLPDLLKQERDKLLRTITKDELKHIAEYIAEASEE